MDAGELRRLTEMDAKIREIAEEFGLRFVEQEFDVVPARKMLEIMAYRLPVNFSHWSFGRDFERERTRHRYGYAVPYEVVYNSDPCRAYLMETNPFPIQVLIMAHVYSHNDFMTNNRHFQHSRRDMVRSASEAASRFRRYEDAYGSEAVERVIDAGMALQWNIDPDEELHPETEKEARERLYGWSEDPPVSGSYDDLIPAARRMSHQEKLTARKKTPPEPTQDLLGYVTAHAPLEEWERDVLSTIKAQALYFTPQRRTKIMNEGWATYWHERIVKRLFEEKILGAVDHGYFNLYNARVKSHNPVGINPYLLGSALFESIEERWNRGAFGEAYREVTDAGEKESWDRDLRQGHDKIFSVRRSYMDWFFVEEFLNKDVIDELDLYIYAEKDKHTHYDVVVEETDWEVVKRILVRSLMNSGVPRILVVDGDYESSRKLYLIHQFEGLPLDDEYTRRTLEHLFFLWKRPVHLETAVSDRENHVRRKLYLCGEDGVREAGKAPAS